MANVKANKLTEWVHAKLSAQMESDLRTVADKQTEAEGRDVTKSEVVRKAIAAYCQSELSR